MAQSGTPCHRVSDLGPPGDVATVREEPVLRDLPNSARLVYILLREWGPLSQQAIADLTGMPLRTVRYGVREVKEATDAIEESRVRTDGRRIAYDIPTREDDDAPRVVGDD
jgi:DNA-directed RNA polymerase specialized sigma24 family protein